MTGSGYDPGSNTAQNFTVNGTVSLPSGLDAGGVPLTASVSVTTIPRLPAPANPNLSWYQPTGAVTASWAVVDQVSGYRVQLYKKDGAAYAAYGAAFSVSNNSYDFTSAIASAGSGAYTFRVTSIGEVNYEGVYAGGAADSPPSAPSPEYDYTAPAYSASIDQSSQASQDSNLTTTRIPRPVT